MNNEFVTFEIAKKLKEKGFIGNGDIGCRCGIYTDSKNYIYDDLDNSELLYGECLRFTISQVLKWLREEKKIHLFVEIADKGWFYTIYPNIRIEDGKLTCDKYILGQVPFKSHEEAEIGGIEYVLDNLI